MLDPSTADDAPDAHIVRRIKEGHSRTLSAHEAIEVTAIARVAAQKVDDCRAAKGLPAC